MIMLVDISNLNVEFAKLSSSLDELGKQMDISVHAMHEDLFNSMHRI